MQSQSTYICRVQSCVWRLPKAGGTHSPGGEGGGESMFWKTPDIGLASYSIISLRVQYTFEELCKAQCTSEERCKMQDTSEEWCKAQRASEGTSEERCKTQCLTEGTRLCALREVY